MKCPNCGQIIRTQRDTCALCGAPLKQKRRKSALPAVLVILAVAVAVCAFLLLLQPADYHGPGSGEDEALRDPRDRIGTDPADGPIETAMPTAEGVPLFRDAVEIIARDRYTLALCADGTVKLAGQSASPEFGFDPYGWTDICQVVAEDAWIAGLTEDGRVLLTGEAMSYAAAAHWAEVVELLYDAGTLFGRTIDGRVLAAGPDLSFDPGELRQIDRLIPGKYDTLAVDEDGVAHVLPWLGMIWDADGLKGVEQVEINSDYALFLLRDGTLRYSLNYTDILAEDGRDDPLADWAELRQLVLGDFCALGLTRDGRVLSAALTPDVPAPDTSGWSGVVQLLYEEEQGFALGLTEDGRVLQAVTAAQANPELDAWQGVTRLWRNAFCTVGLTREGRVLVSCDPGYADIFLTEGWTEITDLALSQRHLVGLRADGAVLVTGDNSFGQCGWAETGA